MALQQLDSGLSTPIVGALVGLAGKTVREIGQQYLDGGLERALFDAPRPGKLPALDAKQRQQIVALACGPPPEGQFRGVDVLVGYGGEVGSGDGTDRGILAGRS